VACAQLGVVAAERPADALPAQTPRVTASKVSLASMREPRRTLARAVAAVERDDVDADAAVEVAAVAGSTGVVGLVQRLLNLLLHLCLKLLGMDSLLRTAVESQAPAAKRGGAASTRADAAAAADDDDDDDDEAEAAEDERATAEPPRVVATVGHVARADAAKVALELSSAGLAASADELSTVPPVGRLGALLGAARAPAAAPAGAGSAAGETAAPSAVAQQLQHLGFSDKFAEAMSQRMAASAAAGRRPADLNTPWARQLLTHLAQLRGKDKDPLVRVQPPAHLSEWVVELTGAPGSLYEGEKHRLQFEFDRSYPKTPPRVKFLRPVPKHEHVYSDGKICLNILYSDWKPEMTVLGVSQSLISMMASASEKKRPPDNAATIMNSIHQDPSKMQWIFHDEKC
jgi:ubiquitin-conjugating enzyme E2 W